MMKVIFSVFFFCGFVFAQGEMKEIYENLESTSPVVRRDAVSALGRMRGSEARLKLTELLEKDPDFGVRSQAADALGNLRDRASTGALVKALSDENRNVRASAIVALGYLRDTSACVPLMDAYKREDDLGLKISVLNVLGVIGDDASVPFLIEALGEENPRLKTVAASSLGRIRNPQALSALLELLEDKDKNVRLYSVRAIGEIGNKKAVKNLEKSLAREKDGEVRVALANSLGLLGSDEGFDIALAAAKSADSSEKRAGLRALGSIGKVTPEVEKVVIEASKGGLKRDAEFVASSLGIKIPVPEKEKK
jgi:HEAT repeat protein